MRVAERESDKDSDCNINIDTPMISRITFFEEIQKSVECSHR